MSGITRPLSVLLLADYEPSHANTTLEHVEALRSLSRHDVRIYNPRGVARSFALDLDEFDAVVVHYTIMAISDHYLAPSFRAKLRRFKGLKMQFIQDDYRQVNEFHDLIRDLGITVLFTLVPEREIEQVWPSNVLPGLERITTLAGYVALDAGRRAVPALANRPLDIVYRGRVLPFWLGRLGQEKAWIAQGVEKRAGQYGLKVDVDWREGARIYGDDWHGFLSSGRATLGSESGATITDFDGSIERRTVEYLARHPAADFEDVHREILSPYEGNVMMNIVSPRVFEAIATRTALVLFPGEYSGVVEPERHYIRLEKDFSNFGEVVERLRDLPELEKMTERAFDDIIASGRYSIRTLVERFDQALDEHGVPRASPGGARRYEIARRERSVLLRVPVWLQHWQGVKARLLVEATGSVRLLDALSKGLLAVVLALRTPAVRPVLRRYVSHLVTNRVPIAPPRAVMEDLLKLALVDRLRDGGLPGAGRAERGVTVSAEQAGDVLVLRSVPASAGAATAATNGGGAADGHRRDAARALPARLVWDHSAFGPVVPCRIAGVRTLKVVVGRPGVAIHEFITFPALADHFPNELARALR